MPDSVKREEESKLISAIKKQDFEEVQRLVEKEGGKSKSDYINQKIGPR